MEGKRTEENLHGREGEIQLRQIDREVYNIVIMMNEKIVWRGQYENRRQMEEKKNIVEREIFQETFISKQGNDI